METAKRTNVGTVTETALPRSDPAGVTRIAFVDDHPTLLHGIAALFSGDARYEIVGTESSAQGAMALAAETRPDIMTLDLSMPGDVFAAIRSIAEQSPTTKLIIFTAYADVDLALQALDAGAHAFVLKGRPSDDLFAAIEAVRKGGLFVSPDFAPKLVAGFRNQAQRGRHDRTANLSPREQQLVQCLFEAKSNKEIARTLNLTEKTVKHYMTNLMNKLQVRSRLEVVLAARDFRNPYDVPDMPDSTGS
jgi:two-component system, NarL family, nitrate/nitrite response regulator NarL